MIFEKLAALLSEQFSVDADSITMDTTFEDLGADSLDIVEMTMAARKDQVDLNVYAPESVTAHASLVEEDLAEILSAHGLTGKRVRVQQELKPLVLTDVFPDLLEGKRSINVKI